MSSEPQANGAAKRVSPKRLLPLLILLIGLGLFFAFDLGHYLSWDALKEHQDWLLGQVAAYGFLANVIFIAIYVVAIAFSVPGGLLMTIVGGFLFGTTAAAVSVIFAATLKRAQLPFGAAAGAAVSLLAGQSGPGLTRRALEDLCHCNADRHHSRHFRFCQRRQWPGRDPGRRRNA
jgi:uncharacterized Tic20 family protein